MEGGKAYFEAKWETLFQEVSWVTTKEEPCFQSEIFEGCFSLAWLADLHPTITRGKAVPKIPSKSDEVTTFKLFFMHQIQTSIISSSHTIKTTHQISMSAPCHIDLSDGPGVSLILILKLLPLSSFRLQSSTVGAWWEYCKGSTLQQGSFRQLSHVWWASKVIWKGTSASPARTLIQPPLFAF